MLIPYNNSYVNVSNINDGLYYVKEYNPELAAFISSEIEAVKDTAKDTVYAAECDAVYATQENYENILRDIGEEIEKIQGLIDGKLSRKTLQNHVNNMMKLINENT